MMRFKQSYYNFIYDDLGEDQIVFYNSRTGSLAVVHNKQYKQFRRFLETGKEIEDKEFLNNLVKCGYLLPEGVNERFLIKNNMLLGRYESNVLSLTIAPTMACNFRCVYCFEQGHYGNTLMGQDTQSQLIDFIKNKLSGVKYLFVTWFGGEPLLGMSVIENLSNELIEICSAKDIQYSANIITNGYLLNKDIAAKLKKYHVMAAQITVDGPKKVHDTRRKMANGNGTFDVIMSNLVEANGILPINLRINVDINNASLADNVVSLLKEKNLLDTVHPYLGLVLPQEETYNAKKCLSNEQFSKINLEFLTRNNIPLKSIYPRPKRNSCAADFYNAWVIDDSGTLYKCLNDIGISEKSVGNIKLADSCIQNTYLIEKYSSFDPIQSAECKDCKILPICMGGCPNRRIAGKPVCEQRKYGIQDYLLACTKSLLNKQPDNKMQQAI